MNQHFRPTGGSLMVDLNLHEATPQTTAWADRDGSTAYFDRSIFSRQGQAKHVALGAHSYQRSDHVSTSNFPAEELRQLFGAYLNQDLMDDYGGPWEAVQDFCAGYPQDALARAAEQVRTLLESGRTEKQLEAAADELGLEYSPPADDRSYRGWLTELGDMLRTQVSAPRA